METGNKDCIEGVGATNNSGYCSTRRDGIRIGAHRNAYIDAYGEIPKGLHIMHICDNRKCINPKHLKAGTVSDNMRDCVAKGRHVSPMRKLTDEQREYILASEKNSAELSKELPVTSTVIRKYRRSKDRQDL